MTEEAVIWLTAGFLGGVVAAGVLRVGDFLAAGALVFALTALASV